MNSSPLSDSIFEIVHSYKVAMRRALKAKELGLNKMYVKCLSFIHASENCTANDIVSHFGRDKAQIARLIKDMIENGWLTKSPDPNDKRSQLLVLTTEGQELAIRVLDAQSALQTKMQHNLTDEEIALFKKIAGKVSENLKL
ncbi:MarR family winged helix-turn-helix transcriptional regulator [Vibrio marisflavi]|uniref:HTH marR-type domain-containing protein n=1 Tax=Vibrio marisflavi CECT 7928 TaxID=634439 RepID=A0ABM8ZZF1_9VIBR|nr:MarR family winged helix-turn-helix transcriptional regulator [Vibrio marisflavi]CAH0536385.1 hypothetical protein VMF7928_00396 [Vibrio marisflavi CECT 7928]